MGDVQPKGYSIMTTRLSVQNALLMVVDLQDRLLPAIHDNQAVLGRSGIMIKAARVLDIPIIWTEQYRRGLGPTNPAIAEAIGDAAEPMEKMAFGCLGDAAIAEAVRASGRTQLILIGIETHVCIMQTALAALEDGLQVFLAEDAISSRRASDRETALRRMAQAGAIPASVEMLIMELLVVAGGEKFKAILPLLKA